jgi:protein O-mannosyl-transferase
LSDGRMKERWAAVRPLWFEKVPFFALALISSVITYRVQDAGGSVAATAALPLALRLENAPVAVVGYLGKLFWPAQLAVLYPHPGEWPTRKVVACVVIVLALSAVALVQGRRRPWLTIGWLWFLGTLVPVIGIVQVGLQSMADRYTYVPATGVLLALVWTVHEAVRAAGARRIWSVVAAALLLGCAAQTWRQIGVWRDSFTLFDHALAVTEKNYVAHDNRGLFLFHAGKIEAAIADYQRALAINPAYLQANNNLGHALEKLGRAADAVPFYRRALQTDPHHVEVRNNLANALSDLGQLAEAMEHYAFVLARQPDHANALNGSGVALAMQGRLPEAKARLEHALRVAPTNASAHNNLGNVCAMLGLRDEAARHYRRAAELKPDEPHTWLQLGLVLSEQAKWAEAAESFSRAIALQPVNPEAQARLGFAYAQLGRRDEALRALRVALQQKPDFAEARAWLQAVEATR